MSDAPRIIADTNELLTNHHLLKRGDVVSVRMPLKNGEEHVLLDLVERGIQLIPSATSQLASRSKSFQARLFNRWMIPNTIAIYDRHQLLEATNSYHGKDISKVILKHNNKNAGIGILLFNSIEDVYNLAACNSLEYPFVIQPFLPGNIDLRVIVLGDYIEGYTRVNPNSFRNNLHCGGKSEPYQLSDDIIRLCREIMLRGAFPYAHLDFMLTQTGEIYLAEINLRGGIRGARISTPEYKRKVAALEAKLAKEITA